MYILQGRDSIWRDMIPVLPKEAVVRKSLTHSQITAQLVKDRLQDPVAPPCLNDLGGTDLSEALTEKKNVCFVFQCALKTLSRNCNHVIGHKIGKSEGKILNC